MSNREEFERWLDQDVDDDVTVRDVINTLATKETAALSGYEQRQPEIDALKDDIERLKTEKRMWFDGINALKADAERYRFLRNEAYECVVPYGNKLNGKRTAWITRLHAGVSFGDAIDVAIKEAAAPTPPAQEGETRLLSHAPDLSTCTLAIDDTELYYDLHTPQSDELRKVAEGMIEYRDGPMKPEVGRLIALIDNLRAALEKK